MRLLALLVLAGIIAGIGYYVYINREARKTTKTENVAAADSTDKAVTTASSIEDDEEAKTPNTLAVKSAEDAEAEANAAAAKAAQETQQTAKKASSRISTTIKTTASKGFDSTSSSKSSLTTSSGSNRAPTAGGGLRNWKPVKKTDDAFKNHNSALEKAAQ